MGSEMCIRDSPHAHEHEEHSEGFKPGEMIMHHIADAHEIHLIGDVAIYLPVIIYDDGIKMFSSSHFYHNEEAIEHNGEHVHYGVHEGYILHHEHIYKANAEGGLTFNEEGTIENEAPLDLSITKSVAGMFLTIIILFALFGSVARRYKANPNSAPKGLQSWLEPLIVFIRDEVAVPSIGAKKADRYVPFLLTTFFFIWISNMLGLIPFIGGFNITGTLSVTMVLAAFVFIITTISGNNHYWGHILWPSGVPLPIKLILVPIEIAQVFIKPLVLMVRLTANITAGHIVILAFVLSLIHI